jgi:hypothetical protein
VAEKYDEEMNVRVMIARHVTAALTTALIAVGALAMFRVGRVAHAQRDDLSAFSDEFDDASRLSEWRRHDVVEGWPSQLATVDVNKTSPDHLYLEPFTSVWYAGFRAPFLFKEVTGDFIATTRVKSSGTQTDFPGIEGSLAGLMVREPRRSSAETWRPEEESYVSFTTGLASGPGGNGPALETTVTTQGRSALEWRQSRTGWVELRIARIGPSFVLLHRFDGENWVVTHLDDRSLLGRFGGMRPGLIEHSGVGTTLQVGIAAMTDWATIRSRYNGLSPNAPFKAFNSIVVKPPEGTPDLRAMVDYVRFRRLSVPQRLQGRRLSELSAPELLSFLGD